MSGALAIAIVAVALVLAAWWAVAAFAGRPKTRARHVAGSLLEIALLVQVVICGIGFARGDGPDDWVVFVCYGAVSLAALPILVRMVAGDPGLWERPLWPALLTAVAYLTVAVVVLRMAQIWGLIDG